MSRQYVGQTYLAVNTLSTQAGQAEATLYEQETDDPESRTPLSSVEEACELIRSPNPDDTLGELLEQIALQYSLTGTAMLWLPHDPTDPGDAPREMYCLSTASVLPQPISPRYPNGAYMVQPWYPAGPYAQIPVSQGVGATIPAEQIVRIKKPHPFFRWIGYSTLYAISSQMDAARMIDVSRTNAFMKGIDPNFAIEFDPAIKQPDEAALRRMEAQLQAIYAGPQNAGRVFAVPVGGRLNRLSNRPAEMAYAEGWLQLLDFGLAAYGVNKAVAGMTGDLNYATLFASLRAFYLMTLGPLLDRIAQKITHRVLRRFFDRSFGLDLQGRAITDDQLQEQQVNTWCRFNLAKVGEVRKLYKLPPSDRDEEWVNPAFGQAREAKPGPGGNEGGSPDSPFRDGAVEADRPDNPEGAGSLGPRKALWERYEKVTTQGERMDRLMGALEKHLSNGIVQPPGKE